MCSFQKSDFLSDHQHLCIHRNIKILIFTINTTLLSLLLSEAQAKDKYFQTYFVLRQHSLVPELLSLRHAINDEELKIIFSH